MITQERLKSLLHYDPATGVFTWIMRTSNCVKIGERAGTFCAGEYRCIHADGLGYLEHRLAWFYIHGRWPADQIDHINGKPSDNRFCNLREATNAENLRAAGIQKSNSTGFRGVCLRKDSGNFSASLKVAGKNAWLGTFKTAAEAGEVARLARLKHYGEFAGRDDHPPKPI